jgi:hypothetical protein
VFVPADPDAVRFLAVYLGAREAPRPPGAGNRLVEALRDRIWRAKHSRSSGPPIQVGAAAIRC